MKYTHVLWDWNGTLIDDLAGCLECIDSMLGRRNIAQLGSVEAYHRVFCFPIRDYYRKAGFDFGQESFEDLAVEFTDLYFNMPFGLQDGAEAVLQAVRDLGVKQVILSATKLELLKEQVASYGILPYFDELIGISDIYGAGKIDVAKQFIARCKPPCAVLIGDTVHDFEVAAALGIDCVLVARGHHSRATLECCGVPVLDDLRDVPGFLRGDGAEAPR